MGFGYMAGVALSRATSDISAANQRAHEEKKERFEKALSKTPEDRRQEAAAVVCAAEQKYIRPFSPQASMLQYTSDVAKLPAADVEMFSRAFLRENPISPARISADKKMTFEEGSAKLKSIIEKVRDVAHKRGDTFVSDFLKNGPHIAHFKVNESSHIADNTPSKNWDQSRFLSLERIKNVALEYGHDLMRANVMYGALWLQQVNKYDKDEQPCSKNTQKYIDGLWLLPGSVKKLEDEDIVNLRGLTVPLSIGKDFYDNPPSELTKDLTDEEFVAEAKTRGLVIKTRDSGPLTQEMKGKKNLYNLATVFGLASVGGVTGTAVAFAGNFLNSFKMNPYAMMNPTKFGLGMAAVLGIIGLGTFASRDTELQSYEKIMAAEKQKPRQLTHETLAQGFFGMSYDESKRKYGPHAAIERPETPPPVLSAPSAAPETLSTETGTSALVSSTLKAPDPEDAASVRIQFLGANSRDRVIEAASLFLDNGKPNDAFIIDKDGARIIQGNAPTPSGP